MFIKGICIILAFLFLFCEKVDSINNPQYSPEDESLEKFKTLSDFSNWPGKNGPVRDGLNLSKYIIPRLSETVEVPYKMPFSLYETEGQLLIEYRSRWRTTLDNFIDVTIIFAETCEDAHEYLIRRCFNTQMTFEARIPKKDQPRIAGDISFNNGRKFIRNNIVVELHAEGEMINKLTAVAKEIDDLLLRRPTAPSASPFKPVIRRFEITNRLLEYRSRTKLIIDVYDPQGSESYYFWRLTGGGIDKDDFGNYYYYAEAKAGSIQEITLIAVNDRGFYASAKLEIRIK